MQLHANKDWCTLIQTRRSSKTLLYLVRINVYQSLRNQMDSLIFFVAMKTKTLSSKRPCAPTHPGSSSPKILLQSHCNDSNDPAPAWKQKYQRPFIKDDALLSDRALLSCHFFVGDGVIYNQCSNLIFGFFSVVFNLRLTPYSL